MVVACLEALSCFVDLSLVFAHHRASVTVSGFVSRKTGIVHRPASTINKNCDNLWACQVGLPHGDAKMPRSPRGAKTGKLVKQEDT